MRWGTRCLVPALDPDPSLYDLGGSLASMGLSLLVAVNSLANLKAPRRPPQVDSTSPSVRVPVWHFSHRLYGQLFHFDYFGVTQPFSHSNMKEVSSGLKADSLTVRLDHLPESTCRHYACGWPCHHPQCGVSTLV